MQNNADRDYLKPVLAFFMRLMFESGGLTYSFKGELAKQKEAPVLVVGPHSSLLDGVVVLLLGGLTPVAKADSEHVPIFGSKERAVRLPWWMRASLADVCPRGLTIILP